ncbi:hypothetical protein HDU91_003038, partial [Kappamyces sp. JEL0680]
LELSMAPLDLSHPHDEALDWHRGSPQHSGLIENSRQVYDDNFFKELNPLEDQAHPDHRDDDSSVFTIKGDEEPNSVYHTLQKDLEKGIEDLDKHDFPLDETSRLEAQSMDLFWNPPPHPEQPPSAVQNGTHSLLDLDPDVPLPYQELADPAPRQPALDVQHHLMGLLHDAQSRIGTLESRLKASQTHAQELQESLQQAEKQSQMDLLRVKKEILMEKERVLLDLRADLQMQVAKAEMQSRASLDGLSKENQGLLQEKEAWAAEKQQLLQDLEAQRRAKEDLQTHLDEARKTISDLKTEKADSAVLDGHGSGIDLDKVSLIPNGPRQDEQGLVRTQSSIFGPTIDLQQLVAIMSSVVDMPEEASSDPAMVLDSLSLLVSHTLDQSNRLTVLQTTLDGMAPTSSSDLASKYPALVEEILANHKL